MSLLVTEGLNKSFGYLAVTKNLDLRIEPGQRHVIIGPNGAGKTTLLNQIAGQLRPDSGRIRFQGRDVTGYAPEAMSRLGLARTFQKNNLFRRLSALENVRLAVQARHGNPFDPFVPVRKIRSFRERAEAELERIGLLDRADRPVDSLSYGEQRQLEIAVALASEPQLVLLDEPTAGLSPAETGDMIKLIAELPADMAILMIEHDLEVVFSIAEHITVLHYGEAIASGPPDVISRNERVQEVYLGASLQC